jgi:hypothetical protein
MQTSGSPVLKQQLSAYPGTRLRQVSPFRTHREAIVCCRVRTVECKGPDGMAYRSMVCFAGAAHTLQKTAESKIDFRKGDES